MTTVTHDLVYAELVQELSAGRVLRPDDDGYAEEIAAFNQALTHRPPYVVAATSTADVAAAVSVAARHDLRVAVQATGHGAVTPIDDGVLVSTRSMTRLDIDPIGRAVTVQAGVKWAAVIAAAAPYGLAPLNGTSSDVGVVGYTLGGGLPVLGRTYGFCADHVCGMTVVLADGSVHVVTADQEPELFWALRGGKGNFGIVTELTVGLVPVTTLYGGGVYYAGDDAAAVLNAYRSWVGTLGEETCTAIALLRLPPLPELPEPLRGKFVVHLRVAHLGTDGDRLVAPMRAAAPVVLDTLGEMPYTAVDSIYQDPDHPLPAYERIELLRQLDADVIDTMLDVAGPGVQTPVLMVELRHLGGALARPAAADSAVSGRDAAFSFFVLGLLMPPVADLVPAAVDATAAAVRPFTTGHTMVNLHGRPGDAGDRARAWPSATYERLCVLKRRYDPQGRFAYGHAIVG